MSLRERQENTAKDIEKLQMYLDEYYNKLGLSVLASPYGKKKPVGKWAKYKKERMSQEELTIFEQLHNISIICGKVSGIIALDVDGEEGWNSLKEFNITYETLRDFPHVATGKDGGYHFYFEYPKDGLNYGNSIGTMKGIDIRGEGGYVLAPPSKHPSGRIYRWVKTLHEAPLVPMPDILAQHFLKAKVSREAEESELDFEYSSAPIFSSYKKVRDNFIDDIVSGWVKGARHAIAMGLSGYLLKNGVSEEDVIETVRRICERAEDSEVEDRLKVVYDTIKLFKTAPSEVIGITGLSKYLEPDVIDKLKRMFQGAAYFPTNQVGFDQIGVYTKDKEGAKVYFLKGKFDFLYLKSLLLGNGEQSDSYIIQISDRIVEVRALDMLKPKEKVYRRCNENHVEIMQSKCPKLADLVNSCLCNLEYPVYHYYSTVGWAVDDSGDLVVPNVNRTTNLLQDPGHFLGLNKTSGKKAALQEIYHPDTVKDFPALFAAIGHVVISIFLEPLRDILPEARTGMLNLVGLKGSGKSTIARIAMAFYGDPTQLQHNWNMTTNAFELMLEAHTPFPVYFDELTIGKSDSWRTAYMLEQREGKKRARVDPDTNEVVLANSRYWNLNVISTGENSLASGGGEGLQGRVIEMVLDKERYEPLINKINFVLGHNNPDGASYGWGLATLMSMLEIHGKDGKDRLVEYCKDTFKEITKCKRFQELATRPDKVKDPRILTNWALIATGYAVMTKIFGFKITLDWLIDVIYKGLEECFHSDEFHNNDEDLYQDLVGYYHKNLSSFADSKEEFFNPADRKSGNGSLLGYTETRDDGSKIIYIVSSNLKDAIRGSNYKDTGLMRQRLVKKGKMLANDPKYGFFRVGAPGNARKRTSFYAIIVEANEGASDE